MIRTFGVIPAKVLHSLTRQSFDTTKYCILGCLVAVRNVRRPRRHMLPIISEQLESPRRQRQFDILDETEFDDDLEKIETELNVDEEERFEQHQKKTIAHQIFIKKKILEKKYFKEHPEPNILTWNTKEQIRSLNRENPDEWTVEKLAESFPVSSKNSIIRILKSKYQPKNELEIIKHDKRAWKHLLALKSTLAGDKEIAVRDYMSKIKSNLAYLTPGDEKQSALPVVKSSNTGIFESIVKDCTSKRVSPEIITEDILRNVVQQGISKKKVKSLSCKAKQEFSRSKVESIIKKTDNFKGFSRTKMSRYDLNDVSADKYSEHIDGEGVESKNKKAISQSKYENKKHKESNLSKQFGSEANSEKGRVVFDDNGEFLYKIP